MTGTNWNVWAAVWFYNADVSGSMFYKDFLVRTADSVLDFERSVHPAWVEFLLLSEQVLKESDND